MHCMSEPRHHLPGGAEDLHRGMQKMLDAFSRSIDVANALCVEIGTQQERRLSVFIRRGVAEIEVAVHHVVLVPRAAFFLFTFR